MGQVIRIDPLNPDPVLLESVAAVVRQGGVIVYPTDTIYGLGCSPGQTQAVERIFKIKERAAERGLLLLVADSESLNDLCADIPAVFHRLAGHFWPGPVTFLMPANPNLSPLVRGERNLVGVRNPDCPYLHLLMKRIPGPLVSTSANVSGKEPTGSVRELKELLLEKVDLLVDGGDVGDTAPSTVVDLSVAPARVVRHGRLGQEVAEAIVLQENADLR